MARFKLIVVVQLLILLFGLQLAPSTAFGEPLPPIPPQSVLNLVASQTGGPTLIPLGVPDAFRAQLVGFNGVLDGVENMLEYMRAVSYFDRSGNLRELVVPLKNSGTAVLGPKFSIPDEWPTPGQIVGVVWQRGRGTMVMVAIFGGMDSTTPYMFRFYRNSTQYYEESLIYSEFVDYFGDGRLERIDQGGLIAHQNSCVSVGLDQLCWWPYLETQLRDQGISTAVQKAVNRAWDRYQVYTAFADWMAVPDIIGMVRRGQCAIQLYGATSVNSLTNCKANLLMAHAFSSAEGEPIGIWVVTANADLKAYRPNGTYTGLVPPGEYLLIDATPNLSVPGQVGVLFLVNINS
ncbi:MAG: hypothetical protein JNM70_24085, partial [Anaerolineae bacterium]|nr:hypothetical protein [Anaerolineae bacterium]